MVQKFFIVVSVQFRFVYCTKHFQHYIFLYLLKKRIQTTKNILPFNTYQMKENFFPKKMNFVSGKIAQSEDKVWVQSSGLRFPANHYPFREPPSEVYPVILGVRPENVHATLGDRKVSTTLGVDAPSDLQRGKHGARLDCLLRIS